MRTLLIFVLFLFSSGIFAQSDDIQGNTANPISRKLQKFYWDMNMGTGFSFIPNFGSGMNYYAAPGFTYPMTNRLSFHGGILTGFSIGSFPVFGDQSNRGMRSGYTSVYGSMSYQFNQNLVLYGTGIKNIASYGLLTPLSFNSFDEISIGSTLRLGNSVTIGASVHFRDYYALPVNSYTSPFFK